MKEEEIRPGQLFDEYIALAKNDAKTYFSSAPFSRVPCPACDSPDCTPLFEKTGFTYVECRNCGTLYANPRPDAAAFDRYYSEAPSIAFWATHFYRQTEEARRTLLIRPKAQHVHDKIKSYYGDITGDSCIVDIGAGYGVFCEELQKLYGEFPVVIAIEPSPTLCDVCRTKGILSIPKFFEDVRPADLTKRTVVAATCFELAEHLQDPFAFFSHCSALLPPSSLLILTTLNWHGFDLQVLRERSKSLQPPAHINFFTPKSIVRLLRRCGFQALEVTTPGNLDADIVFKQRGDLPPGFVRTMFEDAGEAVIPEFQAFLRETGFSSHMMVIARKGGS